MKAYRMKSKDGQIVVRIVNGSEVIKDTDGSALERVGGPIGGSNILPIGVGEKDEFVPFKLDDGKDITTEAEAKTAYEEMYGLKPNQVIAPPPEPTKPTVVDDEDEEAPKRRGRPKKIQDDEDNE